jgi:hypothetical protein
MDMINSKILLLTTLLSLQGTGDKKYTLDKHGIEFTVDSNWKYEKISNDTYSFKFKCDKDVAFCRNIVIKIIKNTEKQTIDELTQTLVDYIPKRFEQYKIISLRDENVNSRQYRVIDYKFRQENVDLGNTTLVTKRDNEFISIYFTALNQPEKSYVNERKLVFELLKKFEVKSK